MGQRSQASRGDRTRPRGNANSSSRPNRGNDDSTEPIESIMNEKFSNMGLHSNSEDRDHHHYHENNNLDDPANNNHDSDHHNADYDNQQYRNGTGRRMNRGGSSSARGGGNMRPRGAPTTNSSSAYNRDRGTTNRNSDRRLILSFFQKTF